MNCYLLIAVLLCPAVWAQSIRIQSGLVDDQVVQRAADGKATLSFGGVATGAEGQAVEARVLARQMPAVGFDWRAIGKVNGGQWTGAIEGVPVGGPYRVEVRLVSGPSDRVNGVLVGDLWLLAGQSNMEGRGYLTEALPPDARVHSFDMRDHWLVAEEPLHTRVDAIDRVYWFLNDQKVPEPFSGARLAGYLKYRDRGTGLGLPFALEMVRRTGVPVGVIPCALGGTNMDQWSPALKDKGGDSLYGATLRRVRAAGGKLKGVIWYQGESDATPKRAPLFQDKFEALVASLREDLGAPGLPFYYVQIGRVVSEDYPGNEWNIVQEAQRVSEAKITNSGMAVAVDLSLVDLAHADAASLDRLGVRLANLACHDQFPQVATCAVLKPGPRPLRVLAKEKLIAVSYNGVNGKLRSAGRVAGFSIHNGTSGPLPLIYAVDVDPQDGNTVLIRLTDKLPAGAVLRYGYGSDPYCNLVDEADMAAPAFTMPIQ